MIVLVVEDEAIVAINLALELEAAGHTILGPTGRGETAIELAREHSPTIALVDITLESPLDGVSLARALRDVGVPSVFLSAHPALARANAEVALGLIEKPYTAADVVQSLDLIAAILDGRKPTTYTAALELFRPRSKGTV